MKNKHMTLDDRIEIQECLTKGMTFKAISEHIGKSRTTISREVKLHMHPYSNSFVRTFKDFLAFRDDNPDVPLTQLDTVIGRIGGKAILTIHFVQSDFMAGLLLENKTAAEAAGKIQLLKARLRESGFSFGDIAPLLLTDNGGEFSIASAFEDDADGNQESRIFFCEPCSPYEKAEIEKNHTLFRDIVKSGSSFDGFTQETVNLIFSHVNAVKRKQFNGKSAYDMFSFYYSEELAEAFGISFIPAKDVVQSPKLLSESFSK